MTPEFQLIQQIRELMQSDMLERTPILEDFAAQFAETCQTVCQRLQRCNEYLAKGMRSEAVHEACSPPLLIELANAINFPELKKWRNVCLDLELPTFPALPEDILAQLQLECARERDLEPLLKQYRRAVYQADRDECIRLLRELREHDPNNPSWPQNLRPLEESKLPEWTEQAREALAADDRFTLKVIYADLTHPQRVAPPPSSLIEAIKDAIMGERREETKRQGMALVARLDKALGAGDGESVDALMAAWEKLETDEAFDATPDMRAIVGRSRDWQALRQREAETQAEFQTRVDSMWALLEQGKADEAEIRHHWDNLLAEGREVPERLTRSVDEAIARRQAGRRHRRRLAGTVVLLLVLAGLAAVAVLAYAAHQRNQKTAILAKLERMLQEEQYEDLDSFLDSLREHRPEIFQLPEVNQYVEKSQAVLKQQDETDRKFTGLYEELTRIRKEGYATSPEQIQRILDEAAPVARTAEARKSLAEWERSWQSWRGRRQQQVDDALTRVTLQVREILESRQRRPFSDLPSEAAALGKVPPMLTEAATYVADASTARVEAFNEVSAQYDAWKRDYERRVLEESQASERLLSLRQGIPAALPDLTRYFDLLGQFVKEFPDEPETASYARILGRKDAYVQALLLEDFRPGQFPPDAAAVEQIAKWLDGPLQDSVWTRDLRACLDYAQGSVQVRQSLPMLLRETKELNLKVFRIRKHGDTDWRLVYYPDTIGTKTEEDEQGNKYQIHWGKIYWYETREQTPYLTHTKDVFPNRLSSLDYDVQIQRLDRDNLVPHAKFLYSFVARAMEAKQLDLHFLQGIKALLADQEIEPVPRAWVLKRLVAFLVKAYPNTPDADLMQELSRKLPTDVPWGNPTQLDVIRANQEIEESLRRFPDVDAIIAKLRTQRELTALALGRRVRCVGSIQFSEGKSVPRFVRQPDSEIWTLAVTATGTRPYFRLAGTVREDGTIRPEKGVEGDLVPGQLLLAPADGRDTRQLGNTFQETPGLNVPDSWPSNAWK